MPISSNRLFVFAVCLVVVALMLVDLVECKSKSKEKKDKSKEKKEEKYEDFKCYGQSLTQNYWEMGRCDPDDKPKGCISLRGCKVTNGEFDLASTQKHDHRACVSKKFLKNLKEDEGLKIDADELCASYFNPRKICDYCKVCHPKKGDGDYCNGEGIHRVFRGATGGLVPLLAFGSIALVAMWMPFGI